MVEHYKARILQNDVQIGTMSFQIDTLLYFTKHDNQYTLRRFKVNNSDTPEDPVDNALASAGFNDIPFWQEVDGEVIIQESVITDLIDDGKLAIQNLGFDPLPDSDTDSLEPLSPSKSDQPLVVLRF